MLKERKELVEHELQKLKREAATLYLEYAIFKTGYSNQYYHDLKTRIADFEHELMVINEILSQSKE